MKVLLGILILALIGGGIWFAMSDGDVDTTPDTTPDNSQPETDTTPPPASDTPANSDVVDFTNQEDAEVEIEDLAFTPQTIRISQGMTVTWKSRDSVPHTVTSETEGGPNSGTLNDRDEYSFTFNEAGTFNYTCDFHPEMKGTVIVE